MTALLLGGWLAPLLGALPPEPHLSCGGNYGWMKTELPWAGKPCPPPQWEPVWELNGSTTPWTPWGPESAEGNIPGYQLPPQRPLVSAMGAGAFVTSACH